MSNYIETAAHNLKAAVEQINDLHDTEGVDITSAQLLKIAEVAALTSIAVSLHDGKARKVAGISAGTVEAVYDQAIWEKLNKGEA